MKECTACGREFQDDMVFCPIDGSGLTPKQSPEPVSTGELDGFIGTILDDKYRLDKKIGEGGMGAVYRGTHVHMDAPVAVKLLHKSMVADQQAVERFRREARAAARIRHANAVSVTDFGVTKEGTVYLVMEYLEGHDLREKLRHVKTMSPEETVKIMAQTCAAIEEAHRKGIVHRDLKPDNIWLLKREETHDEQVKVLDFGIAKLKTQAGGASNLTQQGMIVGTPHYMSPEQCRGEELDARSDIYSLGIIVYEMLTGDVPFRAPTPVAVVLKHANELPKPLREMNAHVPEAIEAVVMRSLEKNRDARQHSAAEFAAELIQALKASGGPTVHLPGSVPGMTGAFASTGSHTASTTGAVAGGTVSMGRTSTPSSGATPAARTGGVAPAGLPGTQFMASDLSYSPDKTMSGVVPSSSHTKLFAIVGAATFVIVGVIVTAVFMTKGGGTPGPTTTTTGSTTGTTGRIDPPGMIPIKGGAFMMGSSDPNAADQDKPNHEVTVKDFYIDKTEVTNDQYQQFIKETGHTPPTGWSGKDYPPGEGNFPVVNLSWYDARDYADWAGKRLPSEQEWEYAARGADGRQYPWGNDWNPQLSNSKEDNRNGPRAVGSYERGASPFGVLDMAGNVAEWVADDYVPYPESKAKPEPGYKVYRGGAYSAPKELLVVTYRWYTAPTKTAPYIGFRCVKDIK